MSDVTSQYTTTAPLVTVGVASFNNASYIGATLDSIRAIDYPNLELLVVDDCSTDDSVAAIEAWLTQNSDFPGRLIANATNQGVCRVCNRFITEAHGKYVCLIGSDDIYLPHKLSTQVAMLEAASEKVGVVYSDVAKIDPHGKITVPSVYGTGEVVPFAGDIWLPMLRVNFIPAMTTLIRRSCFDVVGLYDESLAYEDWDMWLRLARKYEFLYQPEVTALYRIHGGSAMHKRRAQVAESSLLLLQKHVGISAEGDEIINEHTAYYAEVLYLLGSPASSEWLARRWKSKRDMRSFALLSLAKLGIPAHTMQRVSSWVKKIRGISS
ncbi:glycosyltransferase [Hymenobacter psychrotolerans]|uniref:Glycosyl transferase family 2 n=1 Tax=Hymenobacter psychrotolerans DSM 18569 TaxID=1121959 RepID=A0A1M7BG89_9BACT|nr:glycosyltransferase [Hymenobacter psychrotolerans]SHL54000.1 Glycosyl transferase family 2 [Hymenobacter psychrotolerans DSM 18569]